MENSIEGVMSVTLDRIKDMVDVNTVIGNAINTSQDCTIIPVSRVGFGFGVGGGEIDKAKNKEAKSYPFAGGSGAGISITPVGFLVVRKEGVSMLPASSDSPFERIAEMLPNIIGSFKCTAKKEDGVRKEVNKEEDICLQTKNGTIHY